MPGTTSHPQAGPPVSLHNPPQPPCAILPTRAEIALLRQPVNLHREGKKQKKIQYLLLYHVFPHLLLLGCLHDLRPEDEHLLLAHLQLLVGRFQLVQKEVVAVLHIVGGVDLCGMVCNGLPQLIELIFQLLVLWLQLLPLENIKPLSNLDKLPCGASSRSEMPLGWLNYWWLQINASQDLGFAASPAICGSGNVFALVSSLLLLKNDTTEWPRVFFVYWRYF